MERDHLEDAGVDRRIILKRIFRKWDAGVWTGLFCLRIWTGDSFVIVWLQRAGFTT